jgi:hypothetical protein
MMRIETLLVWSYVFHAQQTALSPFLFFTSFFDYSHRQMTKRGT